MESETAKQIYNTLNKIYKEYKGLKGYVTNLSLNNDSNSSHLTSFKPSYVFITSSKKDIFQMVIKSQILLNSRYYLNEDYTKKSNKSRNGLWKFSFQHYTSKSFST